MWCLCKQHLRIVQEHISADSFSSLYKRIQFWQPLKKQVGPILQIRNQMRVQPTTANKLRHSTSVMYSVCSLLSRAVEPSLNLRGINRTSSRIFHLDEMSGEADQLLCLQLVRRDTAWMDAFLFSFVRAEEPDLHPGLKNVCKREEAGKCQCPRDF